MEVPWGAVWFSKPVLLPDGCHREVFLEGLGQGREAGR